MHQTQAGRASNRWQTGLVLALCVYFAMQAALRIWLGQGVHLDEAQQMIMAREFLWGYGSQLPLYNWVQAGVFALVGPSVAAMAVTKNLWLLAGWLLVFDALRRFVDTPRAVLATLGIAFSPEIVWEAQRTLTHSVALFATSALFLAALSRVLSAGRGRDWALFGVALALGGLSKYNFWILPVASALALMTLPACPLGRRDLSVGRGGAIAGAVAAVLLAGPVLWIARNPDLAFASSRKVHLGGANWVDIPFLNGVLEVAGAFAMVLVLAALVAVLARVSGGKPVPPADDGARWLRRLLWRTAVIGAGLLAIAMGWAEATRVTQRWLIPLAMPGVIALILWALEAGRSRAPKVILGGVAVIALIVPIGIFTVFGLRPSVLSYDFRPLREALAEQMAAGDTALGGDGWIVGGLEVFAPDWPMQFGAPLSPAPVSGGQLLQLTRAQGDAPPVEGAELLGELLIAVPDRMRPDQPMMVRAALWRYR